MTKLEEAKGKSRQWPPAKKKLTGLPQERRTTPLENEGPLLTYTPLPLPLSCGIWPPLNVGGNECRWH